MKTLTDHTIIYDDDCPLCKAYTAGFVMAEILDKNGRQPFTMISTELEHLIDKSRACNEIALVDKISGDVTYGVESIFKILAARFPKIITVLHWPPCNKSMRLLYNFISYNRKVIMPGAEFGKGCTPSVHLGYRWMYIAFAWLFSSIILSQYSTLLANFLPAGSLYREFAICAVQDKSDFSPSLFRFCEKTG